MCTGTVWLWFWVKALRLWGTIIDYAKLMYKLLESFLKKRKKKQYIGWACNSKTFSVTNPGYKKVILLEVRAENPIDNQSFDHFQHHIFIRLSSTWRVNHTNFSEILNYSNVMFVSRIFQKDMYWH